MFSQLSDDDFIAKIERGFLFRKKMGWPLLIISLAVIGLAIYFAYDTKDTVLRIADTLSNIGENSSDGAFQEKAKSMSSEFALITGATFGFTLCTTLAGGIHALVSALYLLFDSRKEKLLIEYSKRLQNMR